MKKPLLYGDDPHANPFIEEQQPHVLKKVDDDRSIKLELGDMGVVGPRHESLK